MKAGVGRSKISHRIFIWIGVSLAPPNGCENTDEVTWTAPKHFTLKGKQEQEFGGASARDPRNKHAKHPPPPALRAAQHRLTISPEADGGARRSAEDGRRLRGKRRFLCGRGGGKLRFRAEEEGRKKKKEQDEEEEEEAFRPPSTSAGFNFRTSCPWFTRNKIKDFQLKGAPSK